MLHYKQKKSQAGKGNRLLISITVLGSTGPIRFLGNEHDLVATVIDAALKSYAREGRLPVLGSDINNFVLHCPNYIRTEAVSPWQTIGSVGVRNFILIKKLLVDKAIGDGNLAPAAISRKGNSSFRSWLNKCLNLKISSH